jgi:hypothetical protein
MEPETKVANEAPTTPSDAAVPDAAVATEETGSTTAAATEQPPAFASVLGCVTVAMW